jgi:hypothetical protein
MTLFLSPFILKNRHAVFLSLCPLNLCRHWDSEKKKKKRNGFMVLNLYLKNV